MGVADSPWTDGSSPTAGAVCYRRASWPAFRVLSCGSARPPCGSGLIAGTPRPSVTLLGRTARALPLEQSNSAAENCGVFSFSGSQNSPVTNGFRETSHHPEVVTWCSHHGEPQGARRRASGGAGGPQGGGPENALQGPLGRTAWGAGLDGCHGSDHRLPPR
jgi:hypothetical protein